MRLRLTLPYPPSVNHYWRTTVVKRGRRHVPQIYISEEGDHYRKRVQAILKEAPAVTGPVVVSIVARPPDRRRRDLDNLLKCLLDSLTKAGLWSDDSQVHGLVVVWGPAHGDVMVQIESVRFGFAAIAKSVIGWLSRRIAA